jgi:glycosyltransferase involved in cell wall biosynthesis
MGLVSSAKESSVMNESIKLTVIAIGRNEELNIARLGESIGRLRDMADFSMEAIYVDSASSDNSVPQAKRYFDSVIELDDTAMLCAAGGRAVGTNAARGQWLLFLDGDMQLDDEFSKIVSGLVATADDAVAGYVGDYLHIFPDGHTVRKSYASDKLGKDVCFGGASLLRRSVVIAAGNWDGSIFSHEELDLFARISWQGRVIRAVDCLMIHHWSDYPSRMRRIVRIFLPSGGLGKLFYGIGQLVASRVRRAHRGWDVVAVEPYPIILGCGAAVAIVLAVWSMPLSLAVLMLTAIFVAWARGVSVLVVYVSWFIQAPFGFCRYVPGYQPSIKSVWYREVSVR